MTQSLAIIKWLNEVKPEPPLPLRDAFDRAHVRRARAMSRRVAPSIVQKTSLSTPASSSRRGIRALGPFCPETICSRSPSSIPRSCSTVSFSWSKGLAILVLGDCAWTNRPIIVPIFSVARATNVLSVKASIGSKTGSTTRQRDRFDAGMAVLTKRNTALTFINDFKGSLLVEVADIDALFQLVRESASIQLNVVRIGARRPQRHRQERTSRKLYCFRTTALSRRCHRTRCRYECWCGS